MGSAGIAALIATVAFPILLVAGWFSGELGPRAIAAFLVLGLLARFGLPALLPSGAALISPTLAILDVVLVLMVFKGDVRIR